MTSRYRVLSLAMLASVALHAAVFVGAPGGTGSKPEPAPILFSATLDPGAMAVDEAAGPPPAPVAKRPARNPRPKKAEPPRPEEMVALAPEPEAAPPQEAAEPQPLDSTEAPPVEEKPEVVALAVPATPPPPPDPLPPERFQAGALPDNIKITYALTSNFADGRAVYEWERDGDQYVITGEAQAEGFFAVFLEGRILQKSRGRITEAGLRPERFVETKPGSPPEGLEFDWAASKVTFDRSGDKRVDELKGNTVDWLTMIFQLAAKPPRSGAFDMSVFTQKRMYQFRLRVVGEEEIEIPIGKVKALHLRHVNEEKQEFVDVWLGVDHHYMPVKMRYPVARNRVMVEQTATRIVTR